MGVLDPLKGLRARASHPKGQAGPGVLLQGGAGLVPPWGLLAQPPGPWGVGDRLAPSAGTGTVAAFGYGRRLGMCPHFAESRVTTPDAPLGLMGPWLAVLEPWSEGSAGERGPVGLRLLMGTGSPCWLPAPVRPWWQLCAGPYWPRVLCPQPCLVPLPQMPVAVPLGSSQTWEPSVRRGGWAPRGVAMGRASP